MAHKAVCIANTMGFQCIRLHYIGMSLSQGALTNLYDHEPSIQSASKLRAKETVHLYNVFILNLCVFKFSHIGCAPPICVPDQNKVFHQILSPTVQYLHVTSV